MSEPVVVHGRDFVKYRIGGAIAAVVLGLALVWQVYEIFDGDARTIPEVRWGAKVYNGMAMGPQDEASSLLAAQALAARTTFQAERYQTGPSPEAERPDHSVVPDTYMTTSPMAFGEDFTDGLCRAHLHRLGRDAGCLLGHVERAGRSQLGRGAPRAVAGTDRSPRRQGSGVKGFLIGTVAALALATLTYFGLQFGFVTTAAKYTVQSVQFENDRIVNSAPE